MTTNFTDLTDEELDKLAAEIIMGWKTILFKQAANYDEYGREYRHNFCYVDDKNNQKFFLEALDAEMLECEYFNPTHSESSQARQYIKKALLKKCPKLSIEVTYYSNHTTIAVGHDDEPEIIFWYSFDDVDGKEENRYLVIVALEAWENENG